MRGLLCPSYIRFDLAKHLKNSKSDNIFLTSDAQIKQVQHLKGEYISELNAQVRNYHGIYFNSPKSQIVTCCIHLTPVCIIIQLHTIKDSCLIVK